MASIVHTCDTEVPAHRQTLGRFSQLAGQRIPGSLRIRRLPALGQRRVHHCVFTVCAILSILARNTLRPRCTLRPRNTLFTLRTLRARIAPGDAVDDDAVLH